MPPRCTYVVVEAPGQKDVRQTSFRPSACNSLPFVSMVSQYPKPYTTRRSFTSSRKRDNMMQSLLFACFAGVGAFHTSAGSARGAVTAVDARSKSIPFLEAPAALDGSYAGEPVNCQTRRELGHLLQTLRRHRASSEISHAKGSRPKDSVPKSNVLCVREDLLTIIRHR